MRYLIVLLTILSSCSSYDHGPDREIPVQEYKKMLEIPPDTVLLRMKSNNITIYITTMEEEFLSKYYIGEGNTVFIAIVVVGIAFFIFGFFFHKELIK